jgi:hypothetical protein
MNKQLQTFFDNTKQIHILLSIALLLIIIVMLAPIGNGFIKKSGQPIIIALLLYILFKNFIETHHFVSEQNEMSADIKNNMIASYILCVFIFFLLAYIIYSLFD